MMKEKWRNIKAKIKYKLSSKKGKKDINTVINNFEREEEENV